jgi:hypothetical protein
MKSIYYYLSRILTSNVISILVGIFSGLAINLLTNQDSSFYSCSIVSITIVIIFLILLLFLNESFNEQYHIKKMNDRTISDGDLWGLAILDRNYWKHLFFIYLIVILANALFIVSSIKSASVLALDSNQSVEKKLSNSLTSKTDSIYQFDIEIRHQRTEIQKLNDSIIKLIHIQSVERPRRNNK